MVVDRVADELGCRFRKPIFRQYLLARAALGGEPLYLVKPLTYMNRSGEVLDQLLSKSRCDLEELVVVCDNLDLPVGSCRMKSRGSSAGHNGLASIIKHAGSSEFKRLYVGIGRPNRGSVVDHVLGIPSDSEWRKLSDALGAAANGILSLSERPVEQVMNDLNRRQV